MLCSQSEKKPHSCLLPCVVFFPLHCKKSPLLQSKMSKKHRTVNSQFSNQEKTPLSAHAVCVFPFTHCQKSLIYFFPSSKNAATFSSLFSIRKKRPPRLIAVRVFSLTHCQKSSLYSVPKSHILSAPTTGYSHCPNHWGKFTINCLLNQFFIFSSHCPNNFG